MPQNAGSIIESAKDARRSRLRLVAAPTYLECVGDVVRELREQAGVLLLDIAFYSRLSQGSVSRFEQHESNPRELDKLLLAYAKACEVPPADILREAIRRWEDGGGAKLQEIGP